MFRHKNSNTMHSDTPKNTGMLANIAEIDGNLIATLTTTEYKNSIENYLNVLRSEMKLDNHKRKIFTFSYRADDHSFVIKPTSDTTVKDILKEFAVVNLIPPKAHKPNKK